MKNFFSKIWSNIKFTFWRIIGMLFIIIIIIYIEYNCLIDIIKSSFFNFKKNKKFNISLTKL
jgi:hypothetical protein